VRRGGDVQHREGPSSGSPLPDKREEFTGPGGEKDLPGGQMRQRIDNNRSANNG